MQHVSKNQSGFTLLEMSIVVMIIGLLVGAILFGRDMIHAAQLRGYTSAFNKYEAAGNTFKTKYNCLPGDCLNATDFFGSTVVNGNGNGIIERTYSGASTTTSKYSTCTNSELIAANSHLAYAGLIPLAPFNPTTLANCVPNVGWIDPVNLYSGAGGWTSGNAIWITNTSLGMTVTFAGNGLSIASYLTPYELWYIDNKVDDGMPQTGRVWAQAWLASGAKNDWTYAVWNPLGNAGCQLQDANGVWQYARVDYQLNWVDNCALYFLPDF